MVRTIYPGYPTWAEVEPTVHQTYIGYAVRDMRYRWMVGMTENDPELGPLWFFLRRDGSWADLFDDQMLVLTKRQAEAISAKIPKSQVVNLLAHVR